MLKEAYSELGIEFANDLKQTINLTPTQNARLNHYVTELMKWHRQNKLPQYSQIFTRLASAVQQETPSIPVFQNALMQLDGMPHFEQARHLTSQLADIADTLSANQVLQLEKSLNNEYQKEKYEIKTKKLVNEFTQGMEQLFAFAEVPLNAKQKKILKDESVKFHDQRWYELQYGKAWNIRLISLLKKPRNPQFKAQFTQIWNNRRVKYTGKVLQQRQQDIKRQAKLFSTLIAMFDQDKKNKLALKLQSISDTFSELANQ